MNLVWTRAESFEAFFKANPKVTQEMVAVALGITQGHLSQIIHGKRMPRPDLALRIKRVIGVNPEALARLRAQVA